MIYTLDANMYKRNSSTTIVGSHFSGTALGAMKSELKNVCLWGVVMEWIKKKGHVHRSYVGREKTKM